MVDPPAEPPAATRRDATLESRLDRLNEALERRRARDEEAAKAAESAPMAQGLSTGLRAMSELVASVMVGAGAGWGLDWLLGSRPWALVVGLLLGAGAGFWGVYRLAARSDRGPPGPMEP